MKLIRKIFTYHGKPINRTICPPREGPKNEMRI